MKNSVTEDPIFIKADYHLVRIGFNDIRYVEGMREYVQIHFIDATKKPIMSLLSMKPLEESLLKDRLMRVHRSYIVHLNQITAIERGRILFGKDIYIPIGEQYKESFQEYIGKKYL